SIRLSVRISARTPENASTAVALASAIPTPIAAVSKIDSESVEGRASQVTANPRTMIRVGIAEFRGMDPAARALRLPDTSVIRHSPSAQHRAFHKMPPLHGRKIVRSPKRVQLPLLLPRLADDRQSSPADQGRRKKSHSPRSGTAAPMRLIEIWRKEHPCSW